MSEKYKCAICDGIFAKGWSDAEAEAELGQNFPDTPTEECNLVCHDCYEEVMGARAAVGSARHD